MKVHLKVGIVIGLALISTLVLLSINFSNQVVEIHGDQRAQRLSAQSMMVSHSIEDQAQHTVESLFLNASWELAARKGDLSAGITSPRSKSLPQGPFLGIIQYKKIPNKGWVSQWGSVTRHILNSASKDYWNQLHSQLPWERVSPENVTWVRFKGPSHQIYIAMMAQANVESLHGLSDSVDTKKKSSKPKNSILVGILPIQYFDRLGWWGKGSKGKLLVVDNKGYALVHPQRSYLGANLKAYPAVNRLIKMQNADGTLKFENFEKKKVEASYRKINRTNLYMIMEEPIPNKLGISFELVIQSALQVLGIIIFGWGFLILIIQPLNLRLLALKQPLVDFLGGNPIRWPGKIDSDLEMLVKGLSEKQQTESDTPVTLAEPKVSMSVPESGRREEELKQAYAQLSRGISQSLKGPLASIIGHSQLAAGKVDSGVKEHFEMITGEARKAREVVESLTKFSGEVGSGEQSQRVALGKLISETLSNFSYRTHNLSVSVEEVIDDDLFVHVRSSIFKEALGEIIKNALDAVEDSSQRKIKISSRTHEQKVQLWVEDSGAGCEDLEKVFYPFHSNKLGEGHVGLGLTVATSLVKSMKGDIQALRSPDLGGLKIIVELPFKKSAFVAEDVANDFEGDLPKDVPTSSEPEVSTSFGCASLLEADNLTDEFTTELTTDLAANQSEELDLTESVQSADQGDITISLADFSRRKSDVKSSKLRAPKSPMIPSQSIDEDGEDEFQMNPPSKIEPPMPPKAAVRAADAFVSEHKAQLDGRAPISDEGKVGLPLSPGEEELLQKQVANSEVNFPSFPPGEPEKLESSGQEDESEEDKAENKVKIRPPRLKD